MWLICELARVLQSSEGLLLSMCHSLTNVHCSGKGWLVCKSELTFTFGWDGVLFPDMTICTFLSTFTSKLRRLSWRQREKQGFGYRDLRPPMIGWSGFSAGNGKQRVTRWNITFTFLPFTGCEAQLITSKTTRYSSQSANSLILNNDHLTTWGESIYFIVWKLLLIVWRQERLQSRWVFRALFLIACFEILVLLLTCSTEITVFNVRKAY